MAFGIDDAITAVASLADNVVKRVWPDATEIEKAKIAQVASEMQNQYNVVLAQLDINKEEAKSGSLFVAGARPFIVWVGGFGLAYQILFMPIVNGVLLFFGVPNVFAGIDVTLLQTTLGTILGLGVARSYDKAKGTDTSIIKKG